MRATRPSPRTRATTHTIHSLWCTPQPRRSLLSRRFRLCPLSPLLAVQVSCSTFSNVLCLFAAADPDHVMIIAPPDPDHVMERTIIAPPDPDYETATLYGALHKFSAVIVRARKLRQPLEVYGDRARHDHANWPDHASVPGSSCGSRGRFAAGLRAQGECVSG